MPGASRSYFEAANVESNLLSQHQEIIMVTNMGPDGKPAKENASLGSGESSGIQTTPTLKNPQLVVF